MVLGPLNPGVLILLTGFGLVRKTKEKKDSTLPRFSCAALEHAFPTSLLSA
jgi:hypothetical protein